MASATYWAGGSAHRWFVKERRPSPFVCHADEETLVATFPSSDYSDGESGAARAAEALASKLTAQVPA